MLASQCRDILIFQYSNIPIGSPKIYIPIFLHFDNPILFIFLLLYCKKLRILKHSDALLTKKGNPHRADDRFYLFSSTVQRSGLRPPDTSAHHLSSLPVKQTTPSLLLHAVKLIYRSSLQIGGNWRHVHTDSNTDDENASNITVDKKSLYLATVLCEAKLSFF